MTADLSPDLLPEKAGIVGWIEKGKLDRGSSAGSHHYCLSLLFTPGNKPDPGLFFPDCDLLWPIMEGLGPVEPVCWEACWLRGPSCNNAYAPPFAGHVQEKGHQGGESRLPS